MPEGFPCASLPRPIGHWESKRPLLLNEKQIRGLRVWAALHHPLAHLGTVDETESGGPTKVVGEGGGGLLEPQVPLGIFVLNGAESVNHYVAVLLINYPRGFVAIFTSPSLRGPSTTPPASSTSAACRSCASLASASFSPLLLPSLSCVSSSLSGGN